MPTMVSVCGACNGSGWEKLPGKRYTVDGTEVESSLTVRRCSKCVYWQQRRGETPGVPAELIQTTLSDVKRISGNTDAIERAEEFMTGVHTDLYLWGGTGRGKTFLAVAILNQLFRSGVKARFVRAQELLLQLRGENDQKVFTEVTTVPLLVLDDLGAFQGTDNTRAKMQLIYDKRIDYNNRTIFTANLSLMHLLDFLDDARLPSRIAGRAMSVQMTGTDWRLSKRK